MLDWCWWRKTGNYLERKSGFEPKTGKKLGIQVPGGCRTPEFLRRLKNDFGFSQLTISNDTRDLYTAHAAGFKNEDLIYWPDCCITPENLRVFLQQLKTTLFPVNGVPTYDRKDIHCIYIDEPHDQLKKIGCDCIKKKLALLYNIAKEYHVEFVIGEYNTFWNNWWKEYVGYCDSIAYNGYDYNVFESDQSQDWRDLDSYIVNGKPFSGKRAWISAASDNSEYTELFGTANDLKFKELWLFTGTTDPYIHHHTYDEIGRRIGDNPVLDCENWLKKVVEQYCITAAEGSDPWLDT